MKTKKACKYRTKPSEEQQSALAIQFGHARFVYNAALAARKAAYKETGKGISYNDTAQMLYCWKRTEPLSWLKQADSQVLQQSLKDLDRAYKNFFRMQAEGTLPKGNGKPRKDGRPKGYPTYKSKFEEQSIRYPQRFEIKGNHIYLPKVGWLQVIFHRPLEGKAKNVTVSRTKTGQYFVSIQCEVEPPEPNPPGGMVGIDLGLTHFAILSNGEKIDHPQYLRKTERQLKRAQRVLSRRKKGSAGREKARKRVALLHEKIANQRADFLHKLSCRIASEFGHIKIENLNVAGMLRNHSLAKSISDSGWGEFGRQLGYKSEWRGGVTEKIDRFYPSSKTCSICGLVNQDLELHHRFWTCTGCGTEHDRDVNAAVNIECFDTQGAWGINAGGENGSPVSNNDRQSLRNRKEAQVFRLG